ncbi:acyltransferase [Rummeliibacillus pycnus]|uniref:acyltransferase n=1 Tax=Rummeliibacillus pycnus TaxID=101070 RepID=UPI003D28A9A3
MQRSDKSKVRDSNFELLRIISMFMIVILHIGTHGMGKYINISNFLTGFNEVFYYFIRSLSIIAVSLYVLVSGYFLTKSKFKLKKLVSLFMEVSFFSTVIYLVNVLVGNVDFNVVMFFKSLFSVFTGGYWFVTVYFVMYALSPFMNKLIDHMDKKEHGNLIITGLLVCNIWQFIYPHALVGVSNGYGLVYFLFLYILAAYIQKYEFLIKDFNRNLYLFMYFFVAFINSLLIYRTGLMDQLYSYNSPLVLIMAYCLFQYFKKLKIKSPNINFASKFVFGIYLIHEQSSMRPVIWKKFGIIEDIISTDGNLIIFKMIGYCVIVFISCWIVSFVIGTIYNALYKKVSTYMLTFLKS